MGIILFDKPISGNFIVDIIIWLVSITSSITAGVVLFTLILKLITLPFDFFSRSSMRKNSLKMEEMRPELEKLQKQYADNKDLYNQKMMALYKKNGYSMFGACLPTILTLVIFIVALNGFTAYSQYQNKLYFYNMSTVYNNVVYSGLDIDGDYITRDADGKIVLKSQDIYNGVNSSNEYVLIKTANQGEQNEFDIFAKIETTTVDIKDAQGEVSGQEYFYKLCVKTENSYVICKQNFDIVNENPQFGSYEYTINEEALSVKEGEDYAFMKLACEENNFLKLKALDENSEDLDFDTVYANVKAGETEENPAPTPEKYFDVFINNIQSEMAAAKYREEQTSFLWIKNLWVTDSPMKHPVETEWSAFKSAHAYNGNDIGQESYEKLTANLGYEKTAPNGYFILVAITAGMSFLMQFVTNKSQKAQMELQTVDGQGAQTQKIMMWMMPIMMAIFAFMYTSAFSIYIIISNALSMGTTFLINYVVDKRFKKQKEKAGKGEPDTIRGRVYVPKEEPKQEDKKRKDKKVNKTDEEKGDFLSGTADNKKKHIRGRLK